MTRRSTFSYLVFAIASILLFSFYGKAQGSLTGRPFPAANAWMTTPVSWLPTADPIPASVRQQRDQYFDTLIGLSSPITPVNMKSSEFSDGVTISNQPDIPDLPNRAVVIATFNSYQPVLSRSGRSIYTEIQFVVRNVFQGGDSNLIPGSTLTLIIPGGTIKTEAGVVLSYLTRPRRYSVRVGGTYLLAASFHNTGAFYMLGRSWDLSDGFVRQNDALAPSALTGLTATELINKLNIRFAKPQND